MAVKKAAKIVAMKAAAKKEGWSDKLRVPPKIV